MKFLDKIKNTKLKEAKATPNSQTQVETDKGSNSSTLKLDEDIDIDTSTKKEENSSFKRKRWIRILSYLLLFILSFSIFLYINFPYSILKETIVQKVEQTSGMSVEIEDLSFSFPMGIKLSNIEISTKDSSYKLKKVSVKISVLALIFTRASITVNILDATGGFIQVKLGAGIFNLLFSKNKLPSSISLISKKFSITELASLVVPNISSNPMIAPLLEQIVISGLLDTNIRLKLSDDPKKTEAHIIIKLSDAGINMKSEDLNLPAQLFEKSLIKADTSNGILKIDSASGFESQDLSVSFDGTISLAEKIDQSQLNVSIPVKLKGELLTQYGFLLGGGRGYATYILSGTLGRIATYQK